ncbi:penicillopepsin [Rhizodiscina lignyota]|uniref:Penicillopepsin n=1 Tax=Rhizodiscina lignyota TaxID=1504668 RepID=A0A9P4IRR7_9PEZI|nr:penicillopepsin [Rhizodiscina lignyota]
MYAIFLLFSFGVTFAASQQSFSVTQQRNPNFIKNSQAALAKVQLRYVVTGSVVASPQEFDSEYFCPVTIGDQTLNLDFDSGATDLWVISTAVADAQNHTIFDPTKSETFYNLKGSTFNTSFQEGSGASGTVGTDSISIGSVTSPNQAFGVANLISQRFSEDTPLSGIFGLGFPSRGTITPKKQTPWFFNVLSHLVQPVFTADLKHAAPGSYDFGFIDPKKYTGHIAYVPRNSSSERWQIECSGFAVGDAPVQPAPFQVVLDTGSSFLFLDDTVVESYYKQVNGAQNIAAEGGWVFPCNATLPDISFQIGSHLSMLNKDSLIFEELTATTCFGAVQSNGGGANVFGDTFFKEQFVVFDAGRGRIGVADKH